MAGIALVCAGGARLLADGVLTPVHPALAAVMVLTGFIMLIGFLKGS